MHVDGLCPPSSKPVTPGEGYRSTLSCGTLAVMSALKGGLFTATGSLLGGVAGAVVSMIATKVNDKSRAMIVTAGAVAGAVVGAGVAGASVRNTDALNCAKLGTV